MKILVLHGTSDLYGSGKILLSAVDALILNGHTAIVLLSEEGPLSEAMRNAGADVRIVRLGILRKKYFTPVGFFNRLKVLRLAYIAIKKIYAEEHIDLIYSNTTTVLIGAIFAKLNHVQHIWHVHEMIVQPKFMFYVNGFFLQHFGQRIIAVSHAVKKHWISFVDETKITVIHNGIDTSPFENTKGNLKQELGISDNVLLIGMIGRVNIFKGQEYFLEIAHLLNTQYDNVEFVLVGDAYRGYEYLYERIDNLIRAKRIRNIVHNLGYRKDIPNIIKSLNILILPSQLPDSFPTVILEAMAAAVPVVATEQGGAVEMIEPDVTGYLIPLKNAAIAAEKIAYLITDEQLRIQFGIKGKDRLHQLFTLPAFQQQLISFVNKSV
jgi:glycosyltransferase involved in cell wall biosynthesis